MTSIFVLTCYRGAGEWPYVHDTLAAINAQSAGSSSRRTLVIDCGLEGDHSDRTLDAVFADARAFGWELVPYRDKHLPGNKWAYWRCLELAAAVGDDALIFEDDVAFCRNAIRRMEVFPVPRDLALVQFFAPRIFPCARMIPGLWRPPRFMYFFTQAIKFSAECARKFVAWKADRRFGMFSESDRAIMLALLALDLRYGVHSPELVQHVGAESAAEPGATLNQRTGQMFPGADFDAMSLFAEDDLYR